MIAMVASKWFLVLLYLEKNHVWSVFTDDKLAVIIYFLEGRGVGDTHITGRHIGGGTHITSDMCAGIHISRGYTYHCDRLFSSPWAAAPGDENRKLIRAMIRADTLTLVSFNQLTR